MATFCWTLGKVPRCHIGIQEDIPSAKANPPPQPPPLFSPGQPPACHHPRRRRIIFGILARLNVHWPPPLLPTPLTGDDDRSVTSFFGTALSLAFIVAPCVGAAIDVVGFGLVMTIITLALIVTNSLLLFTPLGVAYPASLIYASGRVSLWATFFSYVGAVFGFVHYGECSVGSGSRTVGVRMIGDGGGQASTSRHAKMNTAAC
jgi:hypothetical protein